MTSSHALERLTDVEGPVRRPSASYFPPSCEPSTIVSARRLRQTALGAAGLAFLAGPYGFLRLLGAFGPVSCWTSRSQRGSGSVVTTRDCEAGIDYLLGSTAGNAPVLFVWAMVLLALVAIGLAGTWTGRRAVTWATAVVGIAISILGLWSIGWVFAGPTLLLLIAAAAMTLAGRRAGPDHAPMVR